jgi:hypothetical protein
MQNFIAPLDGVSDFNIQFVNVPDVRLRCRLEKVIASIKQSPKSSFPTIFENKSELAGFYRLMNNHRVEYLDIFENTFSETQKNAGNYEKIIAIHDTSVFKLQDGESPHLSGMGRLTGKKRGFFGHFCLAVSPKREAVGLLGFKQYVRPPKKIGRRSHEKRQKDPNCESNRWFEVIQQAQERLPAHPHVVHVADREADDYLSYCRMSSRNIRFVFRVQHDRNVSGKDAQKLFDSLKNAQVVCEREVPLSRRKMSECPHTQKSHPKRSQRLARLGIAAQSLSISRPSNVNSSHPKSLLLNFVVVTELDPPEGETPISWTLVTSEPIQSEQQLLDILDTYRARWTIEEYFKALKSGCSYEKRGFESIEAFLRCLALLADIACKVYNIKMLDQESPESSAELIATPVQLQILAIRTNPLRKPIRTVADFIQAIARIGGHLKHNGKPGWQVLMRGYEKLLHLEEGWLLAQSLNDMINSNTPRYV